MSSIRVIPRNGRIELEQRTGRIELEQRTGRIKKAERKIITARDTEATYFDKDGILQTAAPNEIRYSKNFETGKQELLLEEETTNLMDNSDDIEQRVHTLVMSDNLTSPELKNNAFKIKYDGTYNTDIRFYYLKSTINSNTYYTFSIFLKKISQAPISGVARVNAFYHIINSESFNPKNLSNTWTRIKICFLTDNSSKRPIIQIRCDDEAVFGMFGPQLEQGKKATSYIPTQGQPVTRAADKLVFDT